MDDWSGESRGQSSGVVCVVFVGGREEIGRIYVWVGFVVDLKWESWGQSGGECCGKFESWIRIQDKTWSSS